MILGGRGARVVEGVVGRSVGGADSSPDVSILGLSKLVINSNSKDESSARYDCISNILRRKNTNRMFRGSFFTFMIVVFCSPLESGGAAISNLLN